MNKISEEFKKLFKESLDKAQLPHFETLIKRSIYNLDFESFEVPEKDLAELKEWYRDILELDFLNFFIRKYQPNEIIFHSYQLIQIENREGIFTEEITHLTEEDYLLLLSSQPLKYQVAWNYKTPFTSFHARLAETYTRFTLAHSSLSPKLIPKLFIRFLCPHRLPLKQFQLSSQQQALFEKLVTEKKNILICGSTGSGKTTFLKSLSQFVGSKEHVIILEDTHELLNVHGLTTHMLARAQEKGKTLKDFCSYALRMRPDRILLGEIRSNEVVPFLLAMNTGHKGLMATVHANSAQDALARIALLFCLYSESPTVNYDVVLKMVTKNIDAIAFLENKRVIELVSVLGSKGENSFVEKLL